jgi:autotransporter-associated beta strand protein
MKTITYKLFSSLALVAALVTITTASAATIYQDDFNRTGVLNGSTPTITTGGNTWSAANWTTDGTSASLASGGWLGLLAFNPTVGNTYTLTATLNPTFSDVGDPTEWFVLGFTDRSATDNWFAGNTTASAGYRINGETFAFNGPATGGYLGSFGTYTAFSPQTISVVLDARVADSALWTTEVKVNDTTMISPTALGFTPTINYVGIGSGGAGGLIDDFSLSVLSRLYWAPSAGGGGTGTWSAGNTNWATAAATQGNGIQSPTGTLLFAGTAGTATVSGGVNVAAGMTFSTTGYTVTNSTITLTGASAASNTITTAASVGTTLASQLVGSSGMTKAGTGTLTLGGSAANTLTGTTIVSAGTLQLNKSASTTAIAGNLEVATGATLLISQSEQVADGSDVTLSGGTIAKGSGAITETFGDLNLTADSDVDFGTGTGNFTFATYTPGLFDLKFLNFNLGNSFTVTAGTFEASEFDFNGFGYSWDVVPSGGFTITAIPEPSTVLAALGLTGLMFWPVRRRFLRVATGSRQG